MATEMEELRKLKEILFSKRFELASMKKSSLWTEGHLDKVLSKLKNNKSRDLIREIIKPGVIGSDLRVPC